MSEIETARTEFHAAFRRTCTRPLAAATAQRLGVIFTQTLEAGLRRKPGTWKEYRKYALPKVEEIGRRIMTDASGTSVPEPLLVLHADAVICEASRECVERGRVRIFCESYVFTTPCLPEVRKP